MAKISYVPKGVCSRQINVEIEGNIVKNVEFIPLLFILCTIFDNTANKKSKRAIQ